MCILCYNTPTLVYDCDMGKRFYKPPKMVNYRIFQVVHLGGFFIFMNGELFLEIFGYVGMVIVLISFLLTDMKWLRIVNMTGGTICFIYGILTNTMPTALLNISLVTINGFYLIRTLINEKKAKSVNNDADSAYNQKDE